MNARIEDNTKMALNDCNANDENNGKSNLLPSNEGKSTKNGNLKSNNKKRRRSTTTVENSEQTAYDTSSSSFLSSDGNVSIPSLQTQSMDGATAENATSTTCSSDNNSGSQSQLFATTDKLNETTESEANLTQPCDAGSKKHGHGISSLFGNVMKNITASSSVGMTSQLQSQLQPPIPSMSTSTIGRTDPITPARTLLRTPKGSANRSKHKQFALDSPGGFQLLDFVNGFGNSPLFQKFNQVISTRKNHHHQQQLTPDPSTRRKDTATSSVPYTPRNTTSPRNNENDRRASSSSKQRSLPTIPPTPRHDVEWHECIVEKKQMYWIDWSIKSNIEVQYQPSNALDLLLSKEPSKTQYHQQCAIQQFAAVKYDSNSRLMDDAASAIAIDFYSALCYWQHPSIHPLPDHFFSGQTKKQQQSMKSIVNSNVIKSSLPTEMLSSSSGNSRLAMPPPKKHMRAFTTTSTSKTNNISKPNTNDSLLQSRILEWREAFQSLYCNWTDKIRLLNQHWHEIDCNNNLGTMDEFYKNVSETYFYSIGKGHTILFRVGLDNCKEHDASESKPQLQPEIVLSSSSKSLREKLRSMDVDLHLLHEWNCHSGIFDDEWLFGSNSGQSTKTDDATDAASPNVLAELIAMRRQQMSGWRVGPDIAITMKSKVRTQNQLVLSPKRVPPLRIAGIEHCASFFDIYYHSLGQVAVTNYVESERTNNLTVDVPLLICRKIGPFLHSSIKSYNPSRKNTLAGDDDISRNTTIDLCGYFLPCAVRDINCAIVDAMLISKTSSNSCGKIGSETGDNKGVVGHNSCCSYHFVIQTTVHQGDETKNVSGFGGIGTHCSKRLNGPWSLLDTVTNDKIDSQYCHQNEVLNLAVWDESRPTSLAIKLNHTFLSD